MLPDFALPETFDFYVDQDKEWVEAWHTLVHVCRKWRNVVFGSPRRLNLQLFCTHSTPVRETIDFWPLLHILVSGYGYEECSGDNIFATRGQFCHLYIPAHPLCLALSEHGAHWFTAPIVGWLFLDVVNRTRPPG